MSRVPRLPSAVEGEPASFDTMLAHAFWRSDVAPPELKELMRLRGARTIDCNL